MVENYRTETHFMGEKQISNDAYYGIQTQRSNENLTITRYNINENLIIGLAIVKKSAAQENAAVCQLEQKLADAIIQAADEIHDGKMHDQFTVDPIQGGAGTSTNMNANEVI